jgi:hypothetical protein
MVNIDVDRRKTFEFVKETFSSCFPDESTTFLLKIFERVQDLFEGRYPGYQHSDTAYHDLTHTGKATVAVARILDGHIKSGHSPVLSCRDFELIVAATLLHDSGFIKQVGDDEGTGGKYTLSHVKRSGKFAAKFLPEFDVTADEIRLIQLAIDCTGVEVKVEDLPFENDKESFLGWVLGTGDMLGQMAAPDYPESLYALYEEFAEAAAYSEITDSWINDYSSAEDLLRQTRRFYEDYVKRMLETHWGGVHKALSHHFSSGENQYFHSIEANLAHIERQVQESDI